MRFDYPVTPWQVVGFHFGSPWTVGAKACGDWKKHSGLDVQGHAGQPVHATADGVIRNHEVDSRWGKGVSIDHGGVVTILWHVDHLVADGTHVSRGQQVATVYDLGANTHLHVGIFIGPYEEMAFRGALPHVVCKGQPAWPYHFVDPDAFIKTHQEEDDMTPEEHEWLRQVFGRLQKLDNLFAQGDILQSILVETNDRTKKIKSEVEQIPGVTPTP